MKEYKYVEVKFEAKGGLFHCISKPKEIISKYVKEGYSYVGFMPTLIDVFFASTFWRKMQNIFGECCISKLEKVARPRLAAILPAT